VVLFGSDELPDVQTTTLSKDLMGRYICNSFEEAVPDENALVNYDVIVLGAGMYGAYCASKVFQFTKDSSVYGNPRILVLDAGPFLLPEHGQNIPDIGANSPNGALNTFGPNAQKSREAVWGIGWRSNQPYVGTAYCVGGKSLYWGGWCPRLRAQDLEQWPAQVCEYLTKRPFFDPLFGTNVNGAYSVVEYEIGVKPTDDFIFDPAQDDPNAGPGVGLNEGLRAVLSSVISHINSQQGVAFTMEQPEDPPIAVQTQSYISGLFSLDKYSSLPGLIAARRAEGAKSGAEARLVIVPNTHVVRLNLPKLVRDGQELDGYNVTGITVYNNGRFINLKLKPTAMIVVAMGELESTRLALESIPIAQSRKRQELMGANLLNHLRRDKTVRISRQQFNQLYHAVTNSTDLLVERPQTAALHVQASSDRGRFHFQFFTAVNPDNNPNVIYRMVPDLDAARMIAEQGADLSATVNIAILGIGELRGERKGSIITDPQKNWANLASEDQNDPIFQHRRLFTHYADESQNPMWNDMDDAFNRLIQALGAVELSDTGQQGLGTTWHEAGTLWMGDDPYASVTDVNARFHHVGNVVCVDQAIFPTVGSANPVLTGLSLARKAAEGIAERFKSTNPPPAKPTPVAGVRQLWPNEKGKWKRSFDQQPLVQNRDYFETSTFSVINVDRANVGATQQLPVIYFDEEFEDFRLTLQWMSFLLNGDVMANSGVILRSPKPGPVINNAFYDASIEVQIDETGYDFFSPQRTFGSPLHKTGAVYGIAPAKAWAAKLPFAPMTPREGAWNTYVIEVKGATVRVWLNELLLSETDSLPVGLQKKGHIGLQYHTGVTHFGNIRIENL
jgi:choline dehydrogenase-like flavoprotein